MFAEFLLRGSSSRRFLLVFGRLGVVLLLATPAARGLAATMNLQSGDEQPKPQDVKTIEGKLRARATKWITARRAVLKECTECEGKGSRLKYIPAEGGGSGLRTIKTNCTKCKGGCYTIDRKCLATINEVQGSQIDADEVENKLRAHSFVKARELVGFVSDSFVKVKDVQVGPTNLASGRVTFNRLIPESTWIEEGGDWRLATEADTTRRPRRRRERNRPDGSDVEQPAAAESTRSGASATAGSSVTLGRAGIRSIVVPDDQARPIPSDWMEGAKAAMETWSSHATRFTRARTSAGLVEVGAETRPLLTCALDYGEKTAAPDGHQGHLIDALCELVRAMREEGWPGSVDRLVLEYTPVMLDKRGNLQNRLLTRIVVDRAQALTINPDNLKPESVYAFFEAKQVPLGDDWSIWTGQKN